VADRIRSHSPKRTSVEVLDVACGGGFLSNFLALEGHKVTGVDLSEESLKTAHAHDKTSTVKYQTANAYELPFANGSFDVVTCMDFLEHVDRPGAVILECARVLRPGGLFIFHTFNRTLLAGLVVIKLMEWFVPNTPKDMHVLHLFVTPDELRSYCQHASLVVNEMTGIKPVFSSISLRDVVRGFAPANMRFELTRSLKISYMGCATLTQM
jgi:2-polyprenyl-6-hydroxyphenyl methylase/3-demethylubiquinone-9 3-methyltransferase